MRKESGKEQIAYEAAYLLNEAIRELLMPQHLSSLARKWYEGEAISERYAAAMNHLIMMSIIMNLYRLQETRDHFLEGCLFSDNELRRLGFPPVKEFVGDWNSFMIVRGQYTGHVIAKKATKTKPGRILSAVALGQALRKTDLWNSDNFLQRVREELVPGVERVKDELLQRYPDARNFLEFTYPTELKIAAEGGEP